MLAFLAHKAHDPAPVGPFLQKLFASFKTTHKDEWDSFSDRFTSDQLDAVNEVMICIESETRFVVTSRESASRPAMRTRLDRVREKGCSES